MDVITQAGTPENEFIQAYDLLKEKAEQTETELNKIDNNIDEVNKELTNLKIKKQQLRAQISELRKPEAIAEING